MPLPQDFSLKYDTGNPKLCRALQRIFLRIHVVNTIAYVLTRVFISTRNLIPLVLAQTVVGSLLAVALPTSWHHGLRVGPGYYG